MRNLDHLVVTWALNATWQTSLIVLAAALADRLLRRSRSIWHHSLWVSCLVLAVGLPLITTIAALDSAGSVAAVDASPVLNASPARSEAPAPARNTVASAMPAPLRFWSVPVSDRLALRLAAALALVCLGRMAWLALAFAAARRLRRAASKSVPDNVASCQRACEQALGLPPVTTLAVERLAGPVTMGLKRPVILLPVGFGSTESGEVLQAALGHELAHIRRRDYGWNLLYEAALAPLAWHPAAAYLRQQIDRTREMVCDEMVADRILDSRRYAHSLVEIAARMSGRDERWALALGITDGDILRQRVSRLLAARAPSFSLRIAVAALALVGCAGAVALAGRVQAGRPAAPVAGVWHGATELHVVTLRMTESGGVVSGSLELASHKSARAPLELGKAPAPPPPPPPPRCMRPAAGRFSSATWSNGILQFEISAAGAAASQYEFRLTGERSAILRVFTAGKPAYSTTVPLARVE
jgi:beta-lactamase regulating signal transducer with metallopeptidase domain